MSARASFGTFDSCSLPTHNTTLVVVVVVVVEDNRIVVWGGGYDFSTPQTECVLCDGAAKNRMCWLTFHIGKIRARLNMEQYSIAEIQK